MCLTPETAFRWQEKSKSFRARRMRRRDYLRAAVKIQRFPKAVIVERPAVFPPFR